MSAVPSKRQQAAKVGAHASWAVTVDRAQRTARGRARSPGELEWHLERLDPVRFADATDTQRLQAAEAAKAAYFARLAMKSARSRARRKSDAQPA